MGKEKTFERFSIKDQLSYYDTVIVMAHLDIRELDTVGLVAALEKRMEYEKVMGILGLLFEQKLAEIAGKEGIIRLTGPGEAKLAAIKNAMFLDEGIGEPGEVTGYVNVAMRNEIVGDRGKAEVAESTSFLRYLYWQAYQDSDDLPETRAR